ncbi:RluA family pseudouridine synthase [Candidatus Omnitrophota bacterium]
MRTFSFKIEEADSGERLDRFLALKFTDDLSRTFIRKMIDSGCVLIDGSVPKAHRKIKEGETVDVREPEMPAVLIEPEDIPVDIVYEDDDILVVNKRPGIVTHPGPGNMSGTLVNALLHHCGSLSSGGDRLRPGIVHRLDKGTSGLMVVAKNDRSHRVLARQFKKRTVKKTYVAIVKGIVQLDFGTIDLPIARSNMDRKKMSVKFVESKRAVTNYKVLKRYGAFTFIELDLETGRTHQIRVHMSYLGHPILGDDKYGGKCPELKRPALHAKGLAFKHPATKKKVEFTTEIHDDLKKYLDEHEEEKD